MNRFVDGRAAYAYTGGRPFDAALPCVVFIHGALHDHSVWTLAARWFAHHGHGVLAVDQPAHGRSAGPALPSVEALAAWVLAWLDAVGVARAALVGHSIGSLVALEAAARAPARIDRLVMVGTAVPMKVSDALLSTALEAPLVAIDRVNAFSHGTLAAEPSYPGPGSWLHGGNRALMRRVLARGEGQAPGNLFHHDFSLCDAYANGLQAAQAVRCPATLVLGEHDQMTPPPAARELAQALRADTVLLPTGHALMQEAPDALLAALRRGLGVPAGAA
ncbi:alpha/beta hydrolase [Aquincola sp. MAHUQ-54]|uniref:Alpha/beta hydrolase n=1 Tax=Aquincola agrisoli TaxID=3119538 RepID=A0AAW9QND6_9BURK